MRRPRVLIPIILSSLFTTSSSQSTDTTSKRGLAYHDPGQRGEYNIFFSTNSTITWYYNWGPYPSRSAPRDDIQFLPLVHGISDISSTLSTVQSIPSNPQHTHLLTFNEPDGSISSGGSDISPADAAAAYIQYILPLQSSYQLSHPSTTGTGNGLNWLREFNMSCYSINPATGCPSDFVAAHFYGDFPALASWLGQLHEFYPDKRIYITEFALPQMDANDTLRMMNQSLPFLDQLDYVAGYAWFGLFRTDEANGWTGPGPSLLNDNGGLTELGSLYLGGSERGFEVGMTSGVDDGDGNNGMMGPVGMAARGNKLVRRVLLVVGLLCLWTLR